MSTEHACFVTIDNTQNPYALVLGPWNSEHGSFVGTQPQRVPARATLQLELDSTSDFDGPSATLVWTTGIAPNQATITMEFADYFAARKRLAGGIAGLRRQLLLYFVGRRHSADAAR